MCDVAFLQDGAADEEDGVFWISWEAVCRLFAAIHASWSPARFSVRKNAHFLWSKTHSDHNHFDDNPQVCPSIGLTQAGMCRDMLDYSPITPSSVRAMAPQELAAASARRL